MADKGLQLIKDLITRANNGITEMSITGAPRVFLLIFASIFISLGCLYFAGLCLELYKTGAVNYKAINEFAETYFGPAVVGTFVIIGKALSDKNKNGIPDEWEKEENKNE